MLFVYLFGAFSYLSFLLLLIVRDRDSSFRDPFHLIVAMLAAIFWFVAIPLSLLELKAQADKKARQKAVKAMPKLVFTADGKIEYISQIGEVQ